MRGAVADDFARQLRHSTADEERLNQVTFDRGAEIAVLRHLAESQQKMFTRLAVPAPIVLREQAYALGMLGAALDELRVQHLDYLLERFAAVRSPDRLVDA